MTVWAGHTASPWQDGHKNPAVLHSAFCGQRHSKGKPPVPLAQTEAFSRSRSRCKQIPWYLPTHSPAGPHPEGTHLSPQRKSYVPRGVRCPQDQHVLRQGMYTGSRREASVQYFPLHWDILSRGVMKLHHSPPPFLPVTHGLQSSLKVSPP